MNFFSHKDKIEEGDTAILYLGPVNLHAIKVVKQIKNKNGELVENVFQTTYGALKVATLIGETYGSKIQLSRGWAYILFPRPELWTLTLPHRTQIIYTPDISLIVFQLEIGPGSHVIESGTGSGSLTHALARAVHPSGLVFSFDFHETRVQIAQQEFEDHGISQLVKVSQRDVCQDGFGEAVDGDADAVFLDLPHPWLVVPHAVKAFKPQGLVTLKETVRSVQPDVQAVAPGSGGCSVASGESTPKIFSLLAGGRICSFSPCIEQVQKTCLELEKFGFIELKTMECLQKDLIISNKVLPEVNLGEEQGDGKHNFTCATYPQSVPGHTGYLTFATLPPAWARHSSS